MHATLYRTLKGPAKIMRRSAFVMVLALEAETPLVSARCFKGIEKQTEIDLAQGITVTGLVASS